MAKTILTPEAQHYLCINIIERDKDECWKFLNIGHSWIDKAGYGQIQYVKNKIKFVYKAHRLSYMYYNKIEELDDSIFILHKCDNPPCVNPNHLFAGNNLDNITDMVNKKRNHYGQLHVFAKFSNEDIENIRKRRRYRGYIEELAKEYGVCHQTISNIINYSTWKHLK